MMEKNWNIRCILQDEIHVVNAQWQKEFSNLREEFYRIQDNMQKMRRELDIFKQHGGDMNFDENASANARKIEVLEKQLQHMIYGKKRKTIRS